MPPPEAGEPDGEQRQRQRLRHRDVGDLRLPAAPPGSNVMSKPSVIENGEVRTIGNGPPFTENESTRSTAVSLNELSRSPGRSTPAAARG